MEIRNFNYFDNQQVAKDKNADKLTDKDFDLDIKTVEHAYNPDNPIIQGSGHFWCCLTDCYCTMGPICPREFSLIACG